MRKQWTIFGNQEPDEGTKIQYGNILKLADFAMLMSDFHKGYSCPIGTVVASQDKVFLSSVGFDSACGCNVLKLNLKWSDIEHRVEDIVKAITDSVAFGLNSGANGINGDAKIFSRIAENHGVNVDKYKSVYEDYKFEERLKKLMLQHDIERKLLQCMRNQIGSVGGGNHFVDIFVDDDDNVYVANHFGSRGMGHTLMSVFLKAAGGVDDMMSMPVYLTRNDYLFNPYWEALKISSDYAHCGRYINVNSVADILGGNVVETINNHHNFCQIENYRGKNYFVGRKGSTPIKKGKKSFVGSSMIGTSYIVEGTDDTSFESCMNSTVHGAGRIMARQVAKGKYDRKTGECRVAPMITREEMDEGIRQADVRVVGGDVDEYAKAYKDLEEVLEGQGSTVKKVTALYPKIVFMNGANDYDPYKD